MDAWTRHQLIDSGLPTGGFAHSAGLEAAVQLGRVRGSADLPGFVEEALWAAGAFALPFVRATRASAAAFEVADARCDAATPAHVANRASRAQGQALLRAAAAVAPPVAELSDRARRTRAAGHLAPVFGAVLGLLGAEDDEAAHLFLFTTARGILSAAVRLGVVGPLESQSMLAASGAIAAEVLARCRSADPRDAAAAAPILDLLQAHQERLYSRLFQS